MANELHKLSSMLKEYAEQFADDTIDQHRQAILDIRQRVYELELEVDEAFRAGMVFSTEIIEQQKDKVPEHNMYTDGMADWCGRAIGDVVERVATEVAYREEYESGSPQAQARAPRVPVGRPAPAPQKGKVRVPFSGK